MSTLDCSGQSNGRGPYRSLREDPRYAEIKRIIDNLPSDKMELLKRYIQRWTRNA
jgi:hypothetical protein